jgi:hypothetical protein
MDQSTSSHSPFRLTRLKQLLAASLLVASASSFATNYYVVVPVPNRTATAGNILVSLSAYSLPQGLVGEAYAGFDFNSVLQVKGDPQFSASNVRWSVASGALPAGLTLSTDGKLSGTPAAPANSNFQLLASYKTKAGEQSYSVTINNLVVSLAASGLPDGTQGAPYSYDLTPSLAVSGDSAYTGTGVTWSVVSGALPAGLSLGANGVIAGIPTAENAGTPFTVQAAYKTRSGQQAYQVAVGAITVTLASAALPDATQSSAYSYDLKPRLSVSGDAAYTGAGVTWSVVGGSLPVGLSLTSDGVIAGTPPAGSTSTFTIQAAYKAKTGQQAYQLFVAKLGYGTLSATALSFDNQAVSTPSSAKTLTLTNTGDKPLGVTGITGTGPFSVTNTCGSSLAANANCTVSVTFTPTAIGAATGTVKVSASSGDTTVNLSGTGQGTKLVASPTAVDFGSVSTASSLVKTVTLTNNGNIATTKLSFSLPTGVTETDTCGQALAAGTSCTATLTYAPRTSTALSGNLMVSSQDTSVPVALTGTPACPGGTVTVTQLSDYSVTAPAACGHASIAMWGAGGGGYSGQGGGGGYAGATIPVPVSATLLVRVGQGGTSNGTCEYGSSQCTTSASTYQGGTGGGGSFAYINGTLAMAAGGGGGAGGSGGGTAVCPTYSVSPAGGVGGAGGAGGGATGVAGGGASSTAPTNSGGGGGGNQSAGGTGGSMTGGGGGGQPGSSLHGGPASSMSGFNYGGGGISGYGFSGNGASGGGGGGYFGGGSGGTGGGCSGGAGGGGGSGYIEAGATGAALLGGSGTTPGNAGSSLRGSAGAGGINGQGLNGLVSVTWQQ